MTAMYIVGTPQNEVTFSFSIVSITGLDLEPREEHHRAPGVERGVHRGRHPIDVEEWEDAEGDVVLGEREPRRDARRR